MASITLREDSLSHTHSVTRSHSRSQAKQQYDGNSIGCYRYFPPQCFMLLAKSKGPSPPLGLRQSSFFLRPSHLSFVGQARLELLPGLFRILYVNQLLLDRRGVIERDLLAPVCAGNCGPNAHSPSEVLWDICRHHVSDAHVKICRAVDLPATVWKT